MTSNREIRFAFSAILLVILSLGSVSHAQDEPVEVQSAGSDGIPPESSELGEVPEEAPAEEEAPPEEVPLEEPTSVPEVVQSEEPAPSEPLAAERPTAAVQSDAGDASEVEVRVSVDAEPEPQPVQDERVDPRKLSNTMPTRLSRWSTDPARFFASARIDFGYLFFRPRASLGYGKPHQHWGGMDVVPILSAHQGGGYVGFRYRHPRFEIRSGGLYSAAFSRTFMPPADNFDALDLETEIGATASYLAWDAEMKLSFRLGIGYLFAETQSIYLLGVEADEYVFVDTLGVIVAPPWAGRQQLGYSVSIPGVPNLQAGPSVEVVYSPDRSESWVVRAGGVAVFWLYRDLQLRTEVMPTVYSPDTLGRAGSSWLTISARFLWATDDGSKFREK